MSGDLVIVGVGGQGVLTIAELLMGAARDAGLPASFLPTKGMAQRGGPVRAEVRLGAAGVGPRIADAGADLVMAMERSEGLRAIRYLRREGMFLLYDQIWTPLDVILGRAEDPERAAVEAAVAAIGGRCTILRPEDRPAFDGRVVPANIFLLGAASRFEAVERWIDPGILEERIGRRWPAAHEANVAAFRAGRTTAGVR